MQTSQTEKRLNFGDKEIVLIGTAHVSELSVQEVSYAIENEKPDVIAIELDEKRRANLQDPDAWQKMDVIKVLKEKNGFLMIANIVLSAYQKRMGSSSGVKPGDEMLAALTKAKELNIPCEMVDRPVSVTLRRAWAKNSFIGKCNLLSVLLASAFSKEKVTEEQIENLKQKSEMDGMMAELASYLPTVKEVLIDERDKYLACHIWQCKGSKVLAVLGAGHLGGVQAYLEKLFNKQETVDCSDIDFVPEKKALSKILSWLIPILIVALIVIGFVYGGAQKGWNMLSSWFIFNGVFAAIGAIIAAAHPIAIIVSLVGAPFTSLCPFIGIGILSGIVQAALCKPKVSDMESLPQDVSSVKGVYRNRILRTFLVFLLSSLGSSIGTFVAGASFVKVLVSMLDKIIAPFI